MKGVIYARYSEGPRQTDQSIEGQVADCRAYAAEKGIDVVGVYADRHVSGKSLEGRDAFQRMMRDADRKRFDVVIVWKIDRFGRSREDIAVNKIRLRRAGVSLMYARESIPEGPEGILLESLMEGLAEYYSADLRQKVIRGLRETAKKGKVPTGSIPIGYKLVEGRLELDEEKAEAVRVAFRMHIAGATYKEISAAMRPYGVQNASRNFIYHLLRCEKYTGHYPYQGVEIPIPVIIPEETFMEAKKHFKTTRNGSAQKAEAPYILSGKAHCAICGKLLVGSSGRSHTGKVHHYYRCMTKGCRTKSIKKDQLEELVLKSTMEDVLNDDMIELLVARIMDIQEKEEDPTKQLKKRLAENRRQQGNLAASLAEKRLRAVEARLEALEQEEDELAEEIRQAAAQSVMVPEEMVRAWLLSFRSGDVKDPAFQRRLVDTFLADVSVDPENVTMVYNAKEAPYEPGEGSYSATSRGGQVTAYKPVVIGPFILLRLPR